MATSNPVQSAKDVTIDKMDYVYIEKCTNEKELEYILRALRSGREGFYPDLISFCEKKLESLNPKNRALRKQQPVLKARDLEKDEQQHLTDDMEKWSEEMAEMQQNMPEKKLFTESKENGIGDHQSDNLPPIRGSRVLKGGKAKKLADGDGRPSNPDRIKSYDYKAWDKFDVEKECEKVENESSAPAPEKQKIEIETDIDTTKLSVEEKEFKAVREKEKGNEAFKSGDFDEALAYYCRSINLQPIAASYNNRALVYLRLQKWKEAIEDCNTVLGFEEESGNLKAMLRRATALKSLGSYTEAKKDLEYVLKMEPNNARAKSIVDEIGKRETENKKKSENGEKSSPQQKQGKKMVITEVDGESDEESQTSSGEKVKSGNKAQSEGINVGVKGDEKPTDAVRDPKLDGMAKEDHVALKSNKNSVYTSLHSEKASEASDAQGKSHENSQPPEPKITVSNEVKKPVEPIFPSKTAKLKLTAGEHFKTGHYAEACEFYTKAIDSLSSVLKSATPDPGHKMASALLHNNRAACWLKQGNDRACINDCTETLKVKTWDVKAFTRRAVAYEHLEKYALAWADYQSAYSMDFQQSVAQDGANRMAKHLRDLHGSKWRDKVPKVETYSHYSSFSTPSQPIVPKVDNVPQPVNEKEPKVKAKDAKPEISSKTPPKSQTLKEKKTTVESAGAKPKVKPQTTESGNNTKSKKKGKSTKKKDAMKPKDDDAEKQKKRAEITRNLFEKLKSEGNEHVKKGEYQSAIDCYTRCVTLCPKEPASYTNRALCFLKLKKHVSADNDCTEAIKIDPVNIKAYYRRALARKAEGLYTDAERDIKKLLQLEPGNKSAKNELETIKKLAQASSQIKKEAPKANDANTKKNVENPPQKKTLVIEEVDSSSSSDEGEFVLPKDEDIDREKIKEVEKASEAKSESKITVLEPDVTKGDSGDKSKEVSDKNVSVSENSTKVKLEQKIIVLESDTQPGADTEAQSSIKSNHPEKTASKAANKPIVEQKSNSESPAMTRLSTPYEFGNAWNSVGDKSNFDAYKSILDRVNPDDIPKLLSNKIDDDVINVVAKTANQYVNEGNSERGYKMLLHLADSKRFSMAVMFLTDTNPLVNAFSVLEQNVGDSFTKNDIASLRKKYNV